MGAIFQSLGRTITAGVVLLILLVLILAVAPRARPAGRSRWEFDMRWLHVTAGVMCRGAMVLQLSATK